MEMKVWICETWETDGWDVFGEGITLWRNKGDAVQYGQDFVDSCADPYSNGRFQVWEEPVQ